MCVHRALLQEQGQSCIRPQSLGRRKQILLRPKLGSWMNQSFLCFQVLCEVLLYVRWN